MFDQNNTLIALLVVAFVVFNTATMLCFLSVLCYDMRSRAEFYIPMLGALLFQVLSLLVTKMLINHGVDMTEGLFFVAFMLLAYLILLVFTSIEISNIESQEAKTSIQELT